MIIIVTFVVVVVVEGVEDIALLFLFPSLLSNFNVPRNGNVKLYAYVLGICDFGYPHCHRNEL